MSEQKVVLVDTSNKAIGTAEKLSAHQQGLLHRAFSIFIYNDKGEWLLQQRADEKYHSAGLWSNACCSHPNQDDTDMLSFAQKRLQEEMGFSCKLHYQFSFMYHHVFENGLQEHEYDQVYTGQYNGLVNPNPQEVKNFYWVSGKEIDQLLVVNPNIFTVWFPLCWEKVKNLSL